MSMMNSNIVPNVYSFVFEKSEREMMEFMKVFKINAEIHLECVIHECSCEDECCDYDELSTIIINGYHWHVINKWEHVDKETIPLTLNIPYQHDFRDDNRETMYFILKYNDERYDYVGSLSSVLIEHDAEVMRFKVIYYDEEVSFEQFMKDNDLDEVVYEVKKYKPNKYPLCYMNHYRNDVYLD